MIKNDFTELSIFIVDDNRHMLTLLVTMLEALEIKKVEKFTDPKLALEALKMRRPDLVITDWNMAPMTGIELFRAIRGDQEILGRDVPVLMLTAFSDLDKVIEARDAGVTGFLKKPISPKLLYQHIAKAMEAKAAGAGPGEGAS